MKQGWALLIVASSSAVVLRAAYLFETRISSNPFLLEQARKSPQPNLGASIPFRFLPDVARSWLAPWVVQLTLAAAVPLLLFMIGRRAFTKRVGLLSACIGAIYAPFIVAEGLALPSSSAPFLACLAILNLLIVQQRRGWKDWLFAALAVMLFLSFQLNAPNEAARHVEASLKPQFSASRGAEVNPVGEIDVDHDEMIGRRPVAVRRLPLLTFGVIGPFGLLGLLLSLKRWRTIGVLHVACFTSLGLLLINVASGAAYLVLMPPLLVFAAFAVCWAYERAAEDARRSLAVAGVILVLLMLLIHLPNPMAGPRTIATIEESKAGVADKQKTPVMVAPIDPLLTLGGEEYRIYLRRAGQYQGQGKLEEAAQEFERAAALAPPAASLDIRIRLALSLEEGGRYLEAKRRWEEVAALKPPEEIAELARRHLIRMKRKLRTEQPPAADEKGGEEWEPNAE